MLYTDVVVDVVLHRIMKWRHANSKCHKSAIADGWLLLSLSILRFQWGADQIESVMINCYSHVWAMLADIHFGTVCYGLCTSALRDGWSFTHDNHKPYGAAG